MALALVVTGCKKENGTNGDEPTPVENKLPEFELLKSLDGLTIDQVEAVLTKKNYVKKTEANYEKVDKEGNVLEEVMFDFAGDYVATATYYRNFLTQKEIEEAATKVYNMLGKTISYKDCELTCEKGLEEMQKEVNFSEAYFDYRDSWNDGVDVNAIRVPVIKLAFGFDKEPSYSSGYMLQIRFGQPMPNPAADHLFITSLYHINRSGADRVLTEAGYTVDKLNPNNYCKADAKDNMVEEVHLYFNDDVVNEVSVVHDYMGVALQKKYATEVFNYFGQTYSIFGIKISTKEDVASMLKVVDTSAGHYKYTAKWVTELDKLTDPEIALYLTYQSDDLYMSYTMLNIAFDSPYQD